MGRAYTSRVTVFTMVLHRMVVLDHRDSTAEKRLSKRRTRLTTLMRILSRIVSGLFAPNAGVLLTS